MSGINLLPPAIKRRAERRWDLILKGALLVVLAGVLAWYYFSLAHTAGVYREEIRQMRREIKSLQPLVQRQAELTELRKRVDERKQFIAGLRNPVAFSEALTALRSVTPDGITLSRVTVDANGSVSLVGTAGRLDEVAQLLVGMEETGYFRGLDAAFPAPFSGIGGPPGDVSRADFRITGRLVEGGSGR